MTTFAAISAEDAARQGRARLGSLAHAAISRAAIDDHDLEAAASAARKTAELAATVKSSRSIEAVQGLRKRLDTHKGSPEVGKLFEVSTL